MNKIARLALLLAATTVFAQTKPAPAPSQTATPQLSDEVKAKLLSEYKSVLLAQAKVQEKVAAFNAEYQKALAGLPKGTTISVNPDTDSVEVSSPKEEAKPDKK